MNTNIINEDFLLELYKSYIDKHNDFIDYKTPSYYFIEIKNEAGNEIKLKINTADITLHEYKAIVKELSVKNYRTSIYKKERNWAFGVGTMTSPVFSQGKHFQKLFKQNEGI
jgi:phage-related protein